MYLLSTNHKCTQPCYFPLLYKPATQNVKMDCNSSMRSSRLRGAPVDVPMVLFIRKYRNVGGYVYKKIGVKLR
jgi:hypothetical protein